MKNTSEKNAKNAQMSLHIMYTQQTLWLCNAKHICMKILTISNQHNFMTIFAQHSLIFRHVVSVHKSAEPKHNGLSLLTFFILVVTGFCFRMLMLIILGLCVTEWAQFILRVHVKYSHEVHCVRMLKHDEAMKTLISTNNRPWVLWKVSLGWQVNCI